MAICAGPVQSFLGKGWKVTALTCDAKAVDDRFRSAGVRVAPCPVARIVRSGLGSDPLLDAEGDTGREGIVHVHRYRDAFTALLARRLAKRPDIRVVATRAIQCAADATHVFSEGSAETSTPTYSCRIWHTTLSGPQEPAPAPLPDGRVHIIHNSLNLPDSPPPEA